MGASVAAGRLCDATGDAVTDCVIRRDCPHCGHEIALTVMTSEDELRIIMGKYPVVFMPSGPVVKCDNPHTAPDGGV